MDKEKTSKTLDKILKDISSGKTVPVYLLFGEEEYLVKEAFKKLVDSLVPEEYRSLNLEIFKGEKLDLEAVITGLSSYPFFASHKVVAILDQEFPSSANPNLDAFLQCLEKNIPLQNHLIIATAKPVDQRTILFKKIKEIGEILEFESGRTEALKYSSLLNKVNERLKKEGKKISQEVFEKLIEQAGFDVRQIFSEIEKLLIFIGDKKEIEKSDIEAVVPLTKQQVIFTLLDAISRKKKKEALAVLENLLTGGEAPIKINYMMARQMRLLLQAKDFLNNESAKKFNESYSYPAFQKGFGHKIEEFESKYKDDSYNLFAFHPFYIFNVLKLSLNWQEEALFHSFKFIHAADMDLKSSGSQEQEKIVLQKLILSLG